MMQSPGSNFKSSDSSLYLGTLQSIILLNVKNLSMYANDTAMNAHSHNAQAANMLLKTHIARATAYYGKWKIRMNAAKSKSMVFMRHFTENKTIMSISMGGRQISTKRCMRHLVVRLDQRLMFNIRT